MRFVASSSRHQRRSHRRVRRAGDQPDCGLREEFVSGVTELRESSHTTPLTAMAVRAQSGRRVRIQRYRPCRRVSLRRRDHLVLPGTIEPIPRVFSRHWPVATNLGDIATTNWTTVAADTLCGGFPFRTCRSRASKPTLRPVLARDLVAHGVRDRGAATRVRGSRELSQHSLSDGPQPSGRSDRFPMPRDTPAALST